MKTLSTQYQNLLKIARQIILTTALCISLVGCNKDDSPEIELEEQSSEKTIFGKWKANGKVFRSDDAKYILINDDLSISILSENDLGFRSIQGGFEILPDNVISNTFRKFSVEEYYYIMEGDKLSIFKVDDGSEVKLSRDRNGPSTNSWVKTLTILNLADAPWNRNVDIAYDGTTILFPNGGENLKIGLVNPATLMLERQLDTDIFSYPIEVEKSDKSNKLHFQSELGKTAINGYEVASNATRWMFSSIDFGPAVIEEESFLPGGNGIRGLASTGDTTVWASDIQSRELFLYAYDGDFAGTIQTSISLEFVPYGLDFQNGFLYVSDGKLLHKCRTTPSFEAVESYKIPGYDIFGVAYNGSNFVLNAQKLPEDKSIFFVGELETDNKLLRVDLSL